MRKIIIKYKMSFAVAILLTILDSSLQIGVAFFMKFITDATISKNMDLLFKLAILASLFFILQFIFYFISRVARAKYIQNVIGFLRENIFEQLFKLQINDFHKKNSAEYISMLSNDVKLLEESYFEKVLDLVAMSSQLIVTSLALIWIHPFVALIAILLNLLPLAIPGAFNKKMDNSKKIYSDSMMTYTEKLKDYFDGFEVIKSFNIEKELIRSHNISNKRQEKNKFSFVLIESLMNALSFSSAFFIMVIVFALAAFYSINGSVELGTMVAVIMLVNYLVVPIVEISYIIGDMNSVKSIKNKIDEFLNAKEICNENNSNATFNNSIILKDISYSFEDTKVLNKINLKLEKGKKYAIVGGSGSGKTTLAKLILGYYDDYDGLIKLDDINMNSISDFNRYNIMTMIHQNVFMFDDSIINNICLYKKYEEKYIEEAINKSGLDKVITSLLEGRNARIIDNGKNFSGGEKQRFAIARALVKKTNILIMDEATSSLDIETASDIEKSILTIDDLTAIVVTHKLNKSILKMYDEIIVLDDGKIIEAGTYDELMDKKEMFYALLKMATN
ncbi:ABC transporter ATP-binding protein [Helicovermis profundi]|uniref:ABC transporter ATP-binding protein n=1 Tax=Helicovermis profundi TaxID=3065157 RepID=A0AAU9EY94_9FIRM|nr:ABC transporter ATP-binding protein [Clostridia bacterium S502]